MSNQHERETEMSTTKQLNGETGMKTFTSESGRTIQAKTLRDARWEACSMLSVSGPRGLRFQAEDGSGFEVSLYEGAGRAWDANGRTIPDSKLVVR